MTATKPGRGLLSPTSIAMALVAALALALLAGPIVTDAEAKKKADKSAKQIKKLSKQVKKANKLAQQANAQAAEAIEIANQAMEQGGQTGPQGPAGPRGPVGPAGADGADGQNGTDGKSVTMEAEPPGPNCINGGQALNSQAGVGFVCNGEQGPNGNPWTAGGTLPAASTETGTWSISSTPEGSPTFGTATFQYAPISFMVPLEATLGSADVHFVKKADQPTSGGPCDGGTAANPSAVSGHLCVYEGLSVGMVPDATNPVQNPNTLSGGGATAGALVRMTVTAAPGAPAFVTGTWAVTG